MARYPTYEEYRDKPAKGIQRCDELLKKDPSNVQILIARLQLQAAINDATGADDTLERISSARPPTDLTTISTVEEAVVELQSQTYPIPLTIGAHVNKLWDSAAKLTADYNHKLDLHSLRLTRALLDDRLQDAQQALIQLKALAPRNRVFYMAHAALTQQLSATKDDLQSRLALMLARKAVTEKFDDENDLDCRVPGQIFALQTSQTDLDNIKGRRFADSKQVFDALKVKQDDVLPQDASTPLDLSNVAPKVWFNAEIASLKTQSKGLITSNRAEQDLLAFAANAVRLFVTATGPLAMQTYRPVSEAIFLAVSALVKAWTISSTQGHLLQAAFLAESLLRVQPKVHEAKVILVYLYMRLGLGSLAYREWDDLSIKEIQYDTWGHVFLSRISITHPHKLIDIEPPRIVAHALGVYRRCEDKLAETHAGILSHGQTGMIFDLYGLRQHLRLSVTRRLLSLEQRRLARLHNKTADEKSISVQPRLTAAWLDTKDNRDFTAAFDHGSNLERPLHAQDDAQTAILLGLAADSLWCITNHQYPLVKDAEVVLSSLRKMSHEASVPDHEWAVGEAIALMLDAALKLESNMTVAGVMTLLISLIDSLHTAELVQETDSLPCRASCVYMYIDILRIISAFTRYAMAKAALSKDEAKRVHAATTMAFDRLQQYCKERLKGSSASMIAQLTTQHTGLAEELMAIGSDELSSFSAAVARSCQDTWAGAAQYKL